MSSMHRLSWVSGVNSIHGEQGETILWVGKMNRVNLVDRMNRVY